MAIRLRLIFPASSLPAPAGSTDLWYKLFSPFFGKCRGTKIGMGVGFGIFGSLGMALTTLPREKKLVSHTPEWKEAENEYRKKRNIKY